MFIGIDLGASSIKTILIDENQKTIAQSSTELKLSNPRNGYYEQNPDDWFKATLICLHNLKRKNSKKFSSTKAIGISGQMHGATLLDNYGKVLRPCILWNDTRSSKECTIMEKKYPLLRKETGNIAMPGFTAPKILWIKKNEPNIFKKINKILLPKDYLRFRLTNAFFTDMSDASGTLWLNVRKRIWSEKLLNISGLNISNMPSLVEGSEPTEYLSLKIKNEFGFDNNVIVAGGAGDQAAGAFGASVIKNNQSMISLGTSGVYFAPSSKFFSNTNQGVHSFCHCLPKTWHQMSVMLSATNCINWFNNLHGIKIQKSLLKAQNYFENQFISNSTPFFLPYLSGERTPHNNPHLRGSFHLLNTSTNFDSLIYSIVEGISFGIRDGYDAVNYSGRKSNEIYFVGGGSKSLFLSNFIASTLNKEILVAEDSELGPALGVARLAMIATNVYKISDINKKIKIVRKCKPKKNTSKILQDRYEKWTQITKVNNSISNQIMDN